MDFTKVLLSALDRVVTIGTCDLSTLEILHQKLGDVCDKYRHSEDLEIILLGGNGSRQQRCSSLQTLSQYFGRLYRHCGLAANDRQTVLSGSGHLQVVQLCLAEHSKKEHDIFEVDISEVLLVSKEIIQHKLSFSQQPEKNVCPPTSPSSTSYLSSPAPQTSKPHPIMNMYEAMLKRCNMVDLADVYWEVKKWKTKQKEQGKHEKETKYVLVNQPEDEIEAAMLGVLMGEGGNSSPTVSVLDVNRSQSSPASTYSGGDEEESGLSLSVRTELWSNVMASIKEKSLSLPQTPSSCSATETFCRQLVFSYLALLINTRDELSLAQCLSLPDKGLGIDGFTALRRVAKEKNMPLYQTMVSFIMKLRLGGKSYAPDLSSPLGAHVQPMGEFVTLVQKLQTLAEESKDSRVAIIKILATIKSSILKSKDNVLRAASVETAIGDIRDEAERMLDRLKEPAIDKTPGKIFGQGRVIYGQRTLSIIRDLIDRHSGAFVSKVKRAQLLTDALTSQKTPVKLPCIISQFRSPNVDSELDSPQHASLRDRLLMNLGEQEEPRKVLQGGGAKSFMLWAEPVVNIAVQCKEEATNHSLPPQVPANRSQGLWADSPDDRSLAQRCKVGGASDLTPDLLDSIVATPKRKRFQIADAVYDQENFPLDSEPARIVKKNNGRNKAVTKKRLVLQDKSEEDSQPAKKAKKNTTKTKKMKVIPLVKGQKTLSHFFRM